MVKKIRFLLKSIIFNWFTLCLIALFAIFKSYAMFKETNNQRNCIYEEPIDIVYTWVNGSDNRFQEMLASSIESTKIKGDYSKERFDDKNELKFSLRSIEKFAPWVNHVYVVTNGQIPHWLNVGYEKVSIITHSQIFKDLSNLPTFSSPAIESNLHRIPGLSKKFIYFNDDIFLNAPVYREDFYSINRGYFVYLAWNLPECSPNCPWMQVADGQCDTACDTNKCQFDGGDCLAEPIEDGIYPEPAPFSSIQYWKPNTENQQLIYNETVTTVSPNFMKILAINRDKFFPKNNNSNNMPSDRKRKFSAINLHRSNIAEIVNDHNKKTIKNNKIANKRKRFLANRYNVFKNVIALLSTDGYTESLQYTQRLLNKKYGFRSRKVPSHAPILINKEIMEELQKKFPIEFRITERNRFRSIDDIQFSFSYYYFLMSEKIERTADEIFNLFDTDNSGSWSDRELRTLLANMYELPLSYEIVDQFENLLLNCSEARKFPDITTLPYERYINSKLPTISRNLVTHCRILMEQLRQSFGKTSKYKYEIVTHPESKYVTFKMLVSNVTHVVTELDEIRKKRTKFVCLNDNLIESKPDDNSLIRAMLYDFYISILPHQSKFELPEESRNRFLYVHELEAWKQHYYRVKLILFFGIISLTFVSIIHIIRKLFCRHLSIMLRDLLF